MKFNIRNDFFLCLFESEDNFARKKKIVRNNEVGITKYKLL